MIVDRESGAQRDLLAAPMPRALMVLGNLSVAVAVSALQVAALIVAAVLRGATFHERRPASPGGRGHARAGRRHARRGRDPRRPDPEAGGVRRRRAAVALVPWFFAGPSSRSARMPAGLTAFAKVLPLTHALALMRYGLVDRRGTGLHDIWGMHNTTAMAALSLAVVVPSPSPCSPSRCGSSPAPRSTEPGHLTFGRSEGSSLGRADG